MRLLWLVAAIPLLLVGCSSSGPSAPEAIATAFGGLFDATPTPTVLSLGQYAAVSGSEGVSMTVTGLSLVTCNGEAAVLIKASIKNDTALYVHDIPTVTLHSPDNQKNVNTAISDDVTAQFGAPSFYALPQGLPPNATTEGIYCVTTNSKYGEGAFIGTIPPDLKGWSAQAYNDMGPMWKVE